jgi:hypothetical protein
MEAIQGGDDNMRHRRKQTAATAIVRNIPAGIRSLMSD